MEPHIRPITFNIYASSDAEAERGRKAIIEFINLMGRHGAKVSGDKIAAAFSMLNTNSFIGMQIMNFFRK